VRRTIEVRHTPGLIKHPSAVNGRVAKPNEDLLRSMIDVHHNADLMVSFIHIALVDTLWVYPVRATAGGA
jgi:hypothetical protein